MFVPNMCIYSHVYMHEWIAALNVLYCVIIGGAIVYPTPMIFGYNIKFNSVLCFPHSTSMHGHRVMCCARTCVQHCTYK